MKLNDNTLQILRKKAGKDAHRALEDRWEKSASSIDRWIRENNPLLCHPDSESIIKTYLRVDDIFIYEESDLKQVV